MSSYLRKSTKRTAAPRSSSRERDLWLSPYGQPDALRSSKRDRAQQRAKDRQRAQRIAQKTEAAARSARPAPRPRRRPRRLAGAAAACERPAAASVPQANRGGRPAAGLRRLRRGAAAGLRLRHRRERRGPARGLRRRRPRGAPRGGDPRLGVRPRGAGAAAAEAARPAGRGVRTTKRRPPASPLRGREDRATRRARSKRVARAARDSVDLLERLMGPASPESPTPAIDRAAAAALRRDPDDEEGFDGDVAASPVFEGGAFDAPRIQSIRSWRTKWRRSSRAASARPMRTTRYWRAAPTSTRSSPGRPSRATTTLLGLAHVPAGSSVDRGIAMRYARGPRGARTRCLLGTALLTPSRPPS